MDGVGCVCGCGGAWGCTKCKCGRVISDCNCTVGVISDCNCTVPHCSGIVMSPIHQVWPKPSCKAQWKEEEDKADRGRGGKTTLGNGQAWSSPSLRRQWRTGKNGGNRLWNHLWCHNNPCGYGIDEMHGCHRPKLLVLYVVCGLVVINDSESLYSVVDRIAV